MIQEYVREMNAEERAWLQGGLQPEPAHRRRSMLRSIEPEAWGGVVVWALTIGVVALAGGANIGGLAAAVIVGVFVVGRPLLAAVREEALRRKNAQAHMERRHGELARMLEDGRVVVKRVQAVAVVEIEPIEDEGYGYVFDLGDGRVLFLKGQDYPGTDMDEEMPWPNTEFEIVRTAVHSTMLDLTCHGRALPPLRVIPGDDVDPQKGWEEREEVLQMSVDEAVRSVLRRP